jgi:hypothetical protein
MGWLPFWQYSWRTCCNDFIAPATERRPLADASVSVFDALQSVIHTSNEIDLADKDHSEGQLERIEYLLDRQNKNVDLAIDRLVSVVNILEIKDPQFAGELNVLLDGKADYISMLGTFVREVHELHSQRQLGIVASSGFRDSSSLIDSLIARARVDPRSLREQSAEVMAQLISARDQLRTQIAAGCGINELE